MEEARVVTVEPGVQREPTPTIDAGWQGIIRWGGLALFLAAVALVVFIAIVVGTGQTLPLPREEPLEDPWPPALLFGVAAVGEALLLPAGLALYFVLNGLDRTTMLIAAALWLLATPLFLASRAMVISVSMMSDSYLDATSDAVRTAYLVSAESTIEAQNAFSTMAIIALAIASILVGLTMLKGLFSRRMAILVIVAGCLTLAAPPATILGVPPAISFVGLMLSVIWQGAVGVQLYRMDPSG